jgi:hypothetical protein
VGKHLQTQIPVWWWLMGTFQYAGSGITVRLSSWIRNHSNDNTPPSLRRERMLSAISNFDLYVMMFSRTAIEHAR